MSFLGGLNGSCNGDDLIHKEMPLRPSCQGCYIWSSMGGLFGTTPHAAGSAWTRVSQEDVNRSTRVGDAVPGHSLSMLGVWQEHLTLQRFPLESDGTLEASPHFRKEQALQGRFTFILTQRLSRSSYPRSRQQGRSPASAVETVRQAHLTAKQDAPCDTHRARWRTHSKAAALNLIEGRVLRPLLANISRPQVE